MRSLGSLLLLTALACSNNDPSTPTASSGGPDGALPNDAADGDLPGTTTASRSAGCDTSTPLAAGQTARTLRVGGVDRTYQLYVPEAYGGEQPVPLVLDFHFLFGSGVAQRGLSGYAEIADREGFLVAFPDGIDNAWNIGPCCTFSRDVDDLGFALALVDTLADEACIDRRRIFATGFSMGGGMSYFLACNAADVFAAIAPAAFDLLGEMPCAPARPVPVLSFRGTGDDLVLYEGGASNPPNGLQTTIHFQGAEATLSRWAELDGCTGQAALGTDGCALYDTCSGGAEVGLCTKAGGGHEPGDAEAGWAFLRRHPMP
jgi:poly(3-hydroxybutyrate) depolymerase